MNLSATAQKPFAPVYAPRVILCWHFTPTRYNKTSFALFLLAPQKITVAGCAPHSSGYGGGLKVCSLGCARCAALAMVVGVRFLRCAPFTVAPKLGYKKICSFLAPTKTTQSKIKKFASFTSHTAQKKCRLFAHFTVFFAFSCLRFCCFFVAQTEI